MSGGDRKKRADRGEGWEEAGAEFYQESYPGEMDLDHVLQKDPHHLATLLPSKHTRTTTARKKDTKATLRRRTSTRSYCGTVRQNTTGVNNEVQVSIMPDLSENLSNEERTWEEIMKLKTLPVSMAEKKEMKARLLSAETFRLQGLDQLRWQKKKCCLRLKFYYNQINSFFSIWELKLRRLEKDCGTGIVSFFTFFKSLIFLNYAMSWFIIKLLVIPVYFLQKHKIEENDIAADNDNSTEIIDFCPIIYQNISNSAELNFDVGTVFSFIQGTGWIQSTPLFYGMYPAESIPLFNTRINLAIIYLVVLMCYHAGFFIDLAKKFKKSFKQRLLKNQGQFYLYCNLAFSSWDFSIASKKAALARHKSVFSLVREFLKIQRQKDDKQHQTTDESCKLLVIRFTVNLIVLLIYFCSAAIVYYTIQHCTLMRDVTLNYYQTLLNEYLPAMTIVTLNHLIPLIFNYFIKFESYNAFCTQHLSFIRAIILRLLLVSVLFFSIFTVASCKPNKSECVSSSCKTPLCWEVYFGQQIYKLLIFNLVVEILLTFFINFPRKLLASHMSNNFAQFIGNQTFNVRKHILDIAYIQMICWSTAFYAPLLPMLTTFVLFITFFLKKFACVVNCAPSASLYPASELQSLFVFVLSSFYIFSIIPWAYSVLEIMPSKSCGPFRGQPSVWLIFSQALHDFPSWVKMFAQFCSSSWFVMPIIVTLVLLLYYYYSVSIANQKMVLVLKKQLILEGHDKQFLLNRLSAFIRQHQEKHKAMARSVDTPRIK
ncbi:unnamed protein product [Bemisia tabaci]|uniref:TMC domain-containing protein n=1 Tax=Bemisia tabaci TaxID=7038 RepID=A0A9P0A148_BEMTA|nr:unnamed protein product [Bemisia tabaci]